MSAVERDVPFNGGRVELDGRVFVNCTFQNVTLAYEGRDLVVLWNCSFPDPNSIRLQMSGVAPQLIWDVGVGYRFGDQALAENVARYIEGTAQTLPNAVLQSIKLPYLLPSLREIATIPQAMTFALKYIRGEPQGVFHEPVRVICLNPKCRRISITKSLLSPGAMQSSATSNITMCGYCGAVAHIEDHWTDNTGRVFREFADRILRQPGLSRDAIEQLEAATRTAGDKPSDEVASAIEAIDPRLAPIADEVRKVSDRRQFLGRMAILGAVAGAIMLGRNTSSDLGPSSAAAAPAATASAVPPYPTIGARTPTLDETVADLGHELEEVCRATADNPGVSAVDLREMLDACRLEARDRQRLAAEHAAAASGYARKFWDALRNPELDAGALASAVFDAAVILLLNGIAKRLGSEKVL